MKKVEDAFYLAAEWYLYSAATAYVLPFKILRKLLGK